MTAILEVSDLTVQYRRRPVPALDNVSCTIAQGETVALVGESGSGKSTLGNAILGLVPVTRGSITFEGTEDITSPTKHRRRTLTRHIQAIFQDPYGSLNPARSIGKALAEPLRAHGITDGTATRVATALERVGLDAAAAGKYPAQFSGGQRQRIAIARALMLEPRLIICDEPLSALDLSVQAQVLNLLKALQRDLGVSYLFITHDLAIVPHIAHRVVVLRGGQVVETGTVSEVCDHPSQPYTQRLIEAAPVPDPVLQRARRRALLTNPLEST
jgi:ABC-type glutathione transport system ATPase component